MKTLVLALLAALASGCITTASNYRHLEQGKVEVAAGLDVAGGVHIFARSAPATGTVFAPFHSPNVSPQLAIKYGLSRRINLRLQLYNAYLGWFGSGLGFSYKLLDQGVASPELLLTFELGAGASMFAQLFPAAQWPGPAVPFATSQTGVAGSYRFDASTVYFGANVGSYLAPINSGPRLEALTGWEQRMGDWFALRIEARLGVNAVPDFHMPSGGASYPGQISLAPYAAIYPGVVLRF